MRAKKRFGQHFLHDRNAIEHIIAAVRPEPDQHLVEIGPGRGALTGRLLTAAGVLDVVELDRDLIPVLQERCAALGELRIHCVDALRFDFCQLAAEGAALRIVGNLPYNISTPLLFHLFGQHGCIEDMHFMLQKEVVERLAATPGTRVYGRLSVMVQFYCSVEKLFTVGPGSFSPPPKVESAVVRLVPHRTMPVKVRNEALFRQVVNQAFSQRRKTLRNALRGLVSEAAMLELGLDPRLRPECISLEQFAALANEAVAKDTR